MSIGKYKRFDCKLVHVAWSSLVILLSSCSITSSTISYPLTESSIKDTRFLDTIQEQTTFYLGIINTEGFDRFGGTVFEDLQRKINLRNSVSSSPKRIDYYFGEVQTKGLNTIFIVNGVYINEPKLNKIKADTVLPVLALDEAISLQPEINLPASTELILGVKKMQEETEVVKINDSTNQKVESLDDRLIIIACFREEYFNESMLQEFQNELSEIDYYPAKGWVRVYLINFPGYRIYEAKEGFPDAWRAYYGE